MLEALTLSSVTAFRATSVRSVIAIGLHPYFPSSIVDFAFCYFDVPPSAGSASDIATKKVKLAQLYARTLVHSIQHHHPNARIIQLSDHATSQVAPHIDVYRLDVPVDRPNLARMHLYASYPPAGRWTVYVDADMILTRPFNVEPISPVAETIVLCERSFKRGFVQSLTVSQLDNKRYTQFDGKPIEDVMPYLACFAMASTNSFWAQCLIEIYSLSAELQAWFGDQLAMQTVARSGRYDTRVLSERQTAYPVSELGGINLPTPSAFIHFKGNSKTTISYLKHYMSLYSVGS